MNEPRHSNQNISHMLLRLFENWNLSSDQQLIILGLTNAVVTNLSKSLKRYLSEDRDKLDRARILLEIHKSLRRLFPQNREIAYQWIFRPNKAFDGLAPFDVIERNGMLGMYMVRDYLNKHSASREITIESLIDGSPVNSLWRNDHEWLSAAPAGQEFPRQENSFEPDEIIEIINVWNAVLQAFGNKEKSIHWIQAVIPALECAPVKLLTSAQGREKVLGTLKRIENSDFG
ncbi:antitoxin Xre/MbcA/ParS toxin-binding domain-containing protein [Microbulbifer sp. HZ11]|uniref:antitoxin Xre/MbcA/ParS toxin-binding domain-containing protein n=1 Tax=Microbulbifer sp. HZ11 TaxID=1453501 RepID=UPI00068B4333|nr:antitoxin Xre/MbcA/ParS toxin-binding domain-containing protein [Microbulbifer sp. HZ11]